MREWPLARGGGAAVWRQGWCPRSPSSPPGGQTSSLFCRKGPGQRFPPRLLSAPPLPRGRYHPVLPEEDRIPPCPSHIPGSWACLSPVLLDPWTTSGKEVFCLLGGGGSVLLVVGRWSLSGLERVLSEAEASLLRCRRCRREGEQPDSRGENRKEARRRRWDPGRSAGPGPGKILG